MKHDEREALLRELVLGERELDDPRVQEAARTDAAFAQELAALRSVVDALDARAVLREVASDAPREARGPRAAPAASTRRFVLVALVAAAALALLLWRPWSPVERSDPYLGGDEVRFEHPTDGEANSYKRFAWVLPPGVVRARVRVFDAQDARECDEEFVRGTEWLPPPERSAEWPASIELEVQPVDDADSPVGRAARQRRSRQGG